MLVLWPSINWCLNQIIKLLVHLFQPERKIASSWIHRLFITHPVQSNLSIVLSIFCLGRSKKKEHCQSEELYPLEETEACPCDEFLSQSYGNWSACVLPDPSAPGSLQSWMSHQEVKECGQGLRYRAVACIDQQGNPVNPTLCTDTGRKERGISLL